MQQKSITISINISCTNILRWCSEKNKMCGEFRDRTEQLIRFPLQTTDILMKYCYWITAWHLIIIYHKIIITFYCWGVSNPWCGTKGIAVHRLPHPTFRQTVLQSVTIARTKLKMAPRLNRMSHIVGIYDPCL